MTYNLHRQTKYIELLLGDFAVEGTPLPIPNREVKLHRADGTARAALWESRSSPSYF